MAAHNEAAAERVLDAGADSSVEDSLGRGIWDYAVGGGLDPDVYLLLAERLGVPPPYVVVGHSWGGLIATVFAAEHSDEVVGLVLVDPASVFLQDALSPDAWQAFLALTRDVAASAGDVDVLTGTGDVTVGAIHGGEVRVRTGTGDATFGIV